MATEEERGISREEEWRMVREASAEEGKALMAHMTRQFFELYPDQAVQEQQEGAVGKALQQSESSAEVSAKRQQELDAHDRMVMRGAAQASRDALHDNGPGKEPGAYTAQEARDRAAHTPGLHQMEPEK